VVEEGDAAAVLELRGHLVPEDGALRRIADLLDVRPAEPASEYAGELAGALGLGNVGERRLARSVEDDRAHG